MNYYIKADSFLLENKVQNNGYLHVKEGRFNGFVDNLPSDAKLQDWSGYIIAPGLFDTHIHGIAGHDVMDGTEEAIQEISKTLLSLGVTRFLPTTLTSDSDSLEKAINSIKGAVKTGLSGARSEGIFLEGPYFTEKHKGAQNPAYFRNPDYKEFSKWQKLAEGQIVKIAMAPERNGALDFIKQVKEDGVHVSIAHTEASYDCCNEAIEAGASGFVHLFNGMSGLHHRNPGVVGAALTKSEAFAELICDGFHVHPDICTLAMQIKKERLVLITDCMRAGLMPDNDYYLGDFVVKITNGIARTETGSLAGSTLTLLEAVQNLVNWSGRPLHEVWHLASLSPAKSVGKDDNLGSIEKDKLADYVVLDKNLHVKATIIEGNIEYQNFHHS